MDHGTDSGGDVAVEQAAAVRMQPVRPNVEQIIYIARSLCLCYPMHKHPYYVVYSQPTITSDSTHKTSMVQAPGNLMNHHHYRQRAVSIIQAPVKVRLLARVN